MDFVLFLGRVTLLLDFGTWDLKIINDLAQILENMDSNTMNCDDFRRILQLNHTKAHPGVLVTNSIGYCIMGIHKTQVAKRTCRFLDSLELFNWSPLWLGSANVRMIYRMPLPETASLEHPRCVRLEVPGARIPNEDKTGAVGDESFRK